MHFFPDLPIEHYVLCLNLFVLWRKGEGLSKHGDAPQFPIRSDSICHKLRRTFPGIFRSPKRISYWWLYMVISCYIISFISYIVMSSYITYIIFITHRWSWSRGMFTGHPRPDVSRWNCLSGLGIIQRLLSIKDLGNWSIRCLKQWLSSIHQLRSMSISSPYLLSIWYGDWMIRIIDMEDDKDDR